MTDPHVVTLCGEAPSDADCGYCLQLKECHEARAAICRGCIREQSDVCPASYKQKCAERGCCGGREMLPEPGMVGE